MWADDSFDKFIVLLMRSLTWPFGLLTGAFVVLASRSLLISD